ncbi:unnamed protein product, partial [Lymnaea stagnalis]
WALAHLKPVVTGTERKHNITLRTHHSSEPRMDIIFHGVYRNPRHAGPTSTDSAQINTLQLYKAQVYLVASLVFLLFGLPGNILTIMILRKATMKDNFFSTHLTALCVFNCLTLVWCVPRYIVQSFHDRDVLSRDPMFCA